jgi:hypothetical protein
VIESEPFVPGVGRPYLAALYARHWMRAFVTPRGDDYQPRHRLDVEVEADA